MHGIENIEIKGNGPTATVKSISIIGFVATGPAANAATFPIDTPVAITDLDAAIAAAGDTGTLKATLQAIKSQAVAVCIVVRFAPGADQDATDLAAAAAVDKLAQAPQLIGYRPRILGAPGLDTAPVRAALAVAAAKAKLDGMAYCAAIGADTAARTADRDTVSAREIMLIAGDFTDGAATLMATAVALGLRAKIDQEVGPQKTLSNVAVQGVTGLTEALSFDLSGGASDVSLLNEADITALVNLRGFRFWGNRTCSDDSDFAFESAVRVGQMLRDLIGSAVVEFMDKDMHPSLAKDLVEFINGQMALLKRRGVILNGSAWLDVTLNTAEALKTGTLAIDYDYTVPPPLEHLQLRQHITDRYLSDFAALANGQG